MTTITATPDTSNGNVSLDLTLTAPVVRVVRTNVNGSEEVRTPEGQLPSNATGTLILIDFEAAHGLNTYNAYAADGSFVTTSITFDIGGPWLSVPVMPQYSEQVETVTQFSANRDAATTVHRPLGRADALVVMGKLGTRTGTLQIFCHSYAEARTLERVFERGEVVQLRQRVEGLDMYFTATGIPVSPYAVAGETDTRWSLNVNYVEVRRPIGNLAGAFGWTFDTLAADFASFDAVSAAFADFDALTLGDGIV